MIVQFLKQCLDYLVFESGLFYRLFIPVIHRMFLKLPSIVQSNYCIVDEAGAKIRVTEFQGKLYPPVGTGKISGIKTIPIRESDVLIAGYPKTGCHWLYEIVYMLRNNRLSLSPYGKEFGGMIDALPDIILKSVPSPRILNTHLLYDELPYGIKEKRNKIIFTIRCAKDTSVSYYNHNKNLTKVYKDYDGKFENHFKLFMSAKLEYGCFFEYYLDWSRVIRSNPVNEIFVLNFDDLKKDPAGTTVQIAKFLDIDITDQRASDIAQATSFQKIKEARLNDPIASPLFRKGVVGDWKNWMSDSQEEEMDRRWKEVEDEYKRIIDRQNGGVLE